MFNLEGLDIAQQMHAVGLFLEGFFILDVIIGFYVSCN
ncbi:hypothetical protein Bho11B_012620 [Bartonella sp. 11B]|nr:hypothetical protein Bho11B_012620 [Bartonella sp. 11B]